MANKKQVVKKTREEWLSEYGVQAALIKSNDTLSSLFNLAVKEKWPPAKFTAKFQNTDWYKKHADNWRLAETTRLSDPASWKDQMQATTDSIKQNAASLGITLDDVLVAKLAKSALYTAGGSSRNIDPSYLKTHIASLGQITGTGGDASTTIDQLKTYAYRNGVKYDDTWYDNATKDIMVGEGSIQQWKNQIKDVAKSKYQAFSDQLDSGMTVMDVASPYINMMANTFETDAAAITLEDPTIQRALTNLTPDSKPALEPLWKFQQSLKQDDRYFKTTQAHQDMTGLASEIARQFGKAY